MQKTSWKQKTIGMLLAAFTVGCVFSPGAHAFWGTKKKDVKSDGVPTKVRIAVLLSSPKEEPYYTALFQSLERVKMQKPFGLDVDYTITESIAPPDSERVLRSIAQSGQYDIIWAQSSAFVAADTEALAAEFPNLLWVLSGAVYNNPGGNYYHVQTYPHEPAYLMGVIAGMMTENDMIGAVAAYPFTDVNVPVNGFVSGAKSVNPDVKVKMTYIESWFDPPKAKEATYAMISSGADYIYAERFGPFDACRDKGVYAFGQYVDQNDMAPEVVVASALAFWDPTVMLVIKDWYDYKVDGKPFDAPNEDIMFYMKDGGGDISDLHGFAESLPQNVQDKVKEVRAQIMSGELVVPMIEGPVQGD